MYFHNGKLMIRAYSNRDELRLSNFCSQTHGIYIHDYRTTSLYIVWTIYDNTCGRFRSAQLLHKEEDLFLDFLLINISTQELL